MTFFIQSCPACARRFNVHVKALGHLVECRFCGSTFLSSDETEDNGEAVDRIDHWAREKMPVPEESTDNRVESLMRPR